MARPWQSSESLPAPREEKVPPYESVYGGKDKTQEFVYAGSRSVNDDCRPRNIILFGETGVGKSSVINLLAGDDVAKTSSGLDGCTLEAMEYTFTFPGPTTLHIFDTVGLEEPEIGVNTFLGAITKAQSLVKALHNAGGVDLLLFCIRGGRVTTAMQRNYNLFFEVLCGSQVPLAIVVTNLEQEDVMEDWWVRNQAAFQKYGIRSVTHACITALPARIQTYAEKRAESQRVLRNMLLNALSSAKSSYMRDQRNWFFAIVERLRSFLVKNSKFLRKKDLLKKLETECKLPRSDAQTLAEMLAS